MLREGSAPSTATFAGLSEPLLWFQHSILQHEWQLTRHGLSLGSYAVLMPHERLDIFQGAISGEVKSPSQI